MKINEERVARDFQYITNISASEVGCTRLSYSEEDLKVRKYFISELEKVNAEIFIDSLGNIRAKYNPGQSESRSFLIGSHIDTVPMGGKYDGLTGSICSLEILRVFHENETYPSFPLELVIFAEEEGSNFGVTMIGSKYMARKLTLNELKDISNNDGQSAFDFIQSKGFIFKPDEDYFVTAENAFGMIELHVEQGEILDKEKVDIGIVEAIAGMSTYQISLVGISNHAGTTPMRYRKDALLAASEMIYKLNSLVDNYESAVITVGKIDVIPNASNVIASNVVFNIDIRDVIQENINVISKKAITLVNDLAGNKVKVNVSLLGSSPVAILDENLIGKLEEEAMRLKLNYMRINSGAVHDNAMFSGIIPTAMIFVPSIGGVSHSPDEDTKFEDIITGTDLLLNTIMNMQYSI